MRTSHSVEIPAAPADVWNALVDPDWTRRWYHGLVVAGDWRPGGEVSYRFPDGTVAEAGIVVDIQKGRRLTLETRFLWDPGVRDEPAHRTTWELEPAGAGSAHVSVTFEVPDDASATSHMLREEGGYLPRSLRLTLDSAEQARLARREVVGDVEIRDLTPDMLGDYHHFFDEVGFQDHPEWQSCYCSETNLAPDPTRTVTGNRAGMSELIQARSVTALIAFADGQPVGWCNYGETTRLAGVMAKLGLQATDHEKVGSVACFVIASQYRRHGLARTLLTSACTRLKERGCTHVEGYPPKDSDSMYSNYRGPLALYLAAGFEPYREVGKTVIVRKAL